MKQFNFLSSVTRKVIIATIAFLLYGYLCRLVGLYFFWESKTIGWALFWIAIVFIFSDRIKQKKVHNKKTILEKIGVGLAVFVIIIKAAMLFAIKQTSAYESAANFIESNQEIKEKVGVVKNTFLVPFGAISMSTNPNGSAGQADLHFIVKGSEKFIDLNLLMNKEFETDWQIEIVE